MSLSLQGQTVLVTRPKGQAAELAEPLEALGATVVSLPAIAIAPPEDFTGLDAVLWDFHGHDWLVFTSANGVEAVRDRMRALGIGRWATGRPRLAVVGPATAQAAREAFHKPDAMPETYVGEAVADAMGDVRGKRVALLRADIARPELPRLLTERGALVEEIVAYRIVRPSDDSPLPDAAPDWICLTSSSAVHGTRDALAARGREDWMRESRLACIGPLTAATVRELGYEVAALAREATMEGLVESIVAASEPLPFKDGSCLERKGLGMESGSLPTFESLSTPGPSSRKRKEGSLA